MTKKKKPNVFKKIGKGFKNFYDRFVHGSIYTKISYLIMGFGNLARGQIWKGMIFLVCQVGFVLLMVLCPEINSTPFGYKAFANLITLGDNPGDINTAADNSMLMLLFGVLMIGITFLYLALYVSNTKSSYHNDMLLKEGKKVSNFKEDLHDLTDSKFHLTMMIPAMVGILIFTLLPTIFMILIAFTNYDSLHTGQNLVDWVGFSNFAQIFNGSASEIGTMFFPVLGWTFVWAFIATFSNYFLGIFLGILINKRGIKAKVLWRTIFILTIALPQFITLLAVRKILGNLGPVNTLLVKLGILASPVEFLDQAANEFTARGMVLLINLWIGIPYTMLQTSGILMNIPKDLYEAATVDGATRRQTFWKITFPYILFVTTPYLISSFVGNITSFNIIYLLTGGGPTNPGFKAGETDLLVTWLYKLTIDENEYNMGAVISIMTFIITASITLIFYSRSKAFKQEDAFQ